eukprot:scaffold18737_cov64-Cylindrotheca_fusiformis.AAC.1
MRSETLLLEKPIVPLSMGNMVINTNKIHSQAIFVFNIVLDSPQQGYKLPIDVHMCDAETSMVIHAKHFIHCLKHVVDGT